MSVNQNDHEVNWYVVFVAMQRNADDVKSSEDLVEFSQRLVTEDMSQQMFTYAFHFTVTNLLENLESPGI